MTRGFFCDKIYIRNKNYSYFAKESFIMTRQRKLIYGYLASTKTHPTAEEILSHVRKEMPTIAMGTVYRNLSLLAEEGKIRHITVPDHPDRYDGDIAPHDHLLCIRCRRLFDIEAQEREIPKIPEGAQYISSEVTVNIICPSCIESKN